MITHRTHVKFNVTKTLQPQGPLDAKITKVLRGNDGERGEGKGERGGDR